MSPPSSSSAPADPRRRVHALPPPAVDERLVMPETRYEAIDGKISYVCPSDEPHGTLHSKIAALLEAHVVAAYNVAVDMLTRTSKKNDLAPDASVFPAARDAKTGGRQLEELAFEVVSTESLAHAGNKARILAARGVRRVFAIDVERKRALEWSRATGAWEILAPGGAIEDRTLALPLPLRDLVDAMKADDPMARALLAKKNPVIEEALHEARVEAKREGKIEGEREGKREGERTGTIKAKRQAILQVLAVRGLRIKKKAGERLQAEQDEAVLDGWLAGAVTCSSVDALLG